MTTNAYTMTSYGCVYPHYIYCTMSTELVTESNTSIAG